MSELTSNEQSGVDGAGLPRFVVDLNALLRPHDMVWDGPLPSDWRRGAPLGNGEFGAMLYGGPADLAIVLSRPDVWDRRNDDRSWFPTPTFADQRAAWQAGDEAGLDRLWGEAAARKPIDMPHLTTCGKLRLHLDEGLNPADLKLRVGLADGTARMVWNDRSLTARVSRRYGVLMLEFDRGRGRVDPDPREDCYDRQRPMTELAWELSRPPLDVNPVPELAPGDDVTLLVQRFAAGGHVAVGISFDGFGVHERSTVSGRVLGREADPAGQTCRIYVTLSSSWQHDDPAAECRRRLREAIAAGPQVIAEEHARWWSDYWMRGLAAVGDPAVERWYYRSLYMCGSSLEPGRQLPGLQGVWCGENYPVWYGDYHSNVNVQCNVWGLFANNRLDLIEPFLRLYAGFAAHGRDVARDYFKMRGLKFPHGGTIGGHEDSSPSHSRLSTEPCESAWVARVFWDYWRYSGDLAFLRDVAYPILRDVALFLADYLTWDDRGGCWRMGPMVHYESQAHSWEGWDDNTLYGQAFIRMGLLQALEAAHELDADRDLQDLWQGRLDQLVAPPAGPDGGWQAWEHCPLASTGHSFMLPMVFPGELVSAEHGPQEWQRQALRTWQAQRESGAKTMSGGAMFGGQGIAEVLRLGDVETAFAAARWPAGACPNGMSTYDWRSYACIQADHILGMCRVLADLVLLDLGGVLHLFYGIPAEVPARFFSLRAPGGFLVSAEKRGRTPDYAVVQATREGLLRIANPWPQAEVRGVSVSAPSVTSARVIEWPMRADETVILAPPGCPPESLPCVPFRLTGDAEAGTSGPK